MAAPVPSETAVEALDLVVAELGDPAITRGRMMGRPIISWNGTMFGCLNGDTLALKLGAETPEHAAALQVAGAELFDPGGKSRPFRDWVSLPLDAAEEWIAFATCSLAYVAVR
jgi:hypothetical protein